MLDKLETARKHAAQEMYKDADDVSRDMRAKYGFSSFAFSSHKICKRLI